MKKNKYYQLRTTAVRN